MANNNAGTSLNKTAKLAGALFLCTFILPTLIWIFVTSKFIVAGNAVAAANNIMANELLFRINIIAELTKSALALVFALTLYILLKSTNKNLSLLALFLKITEGILLAVIALGYFIALLILDQRASLAVFGSEQIQALVGAFINPYFYISAIVLIFHGLSSMVFLYLLFRSKYVPGKLAWFGIISYAFVFIYALLLILVPDSATMLTIQIICLAPSVLTELILGSWLLMKGIVSEPK
jgi:hypothetical protein